MVKMEGFEPTTPCMSSKYSNQLSYTFIFNWRPFVPCLNIIIYFLPECKLFLPKKARKCPRPQAGGRICDYIPCMNSGAKVRAMMLIRLIRMFSEGPEVSLQGSPTVSPLTAAA